MYERSYNAVRGASDGGQPLDEITIRTTNATEATTNTADPSSQPWKVAGGDDHGYPEPLVDHAEERAEALSRYESTRGRPSPSGDHA